MSVFDPSPVAKFCFNQKCRKKIRRKRNSFSWFCAACDRRLERSVKRDRKLYEKKRAQELAR